MDIQALSATSNRPLSLGATTVMANPPLNNQLAPEMVACNSRQRTEATVSTSGVIATGTAAHVTRKEPELVNLIRAHLVCLDNEGKLGATLLQKGIWWEGETTGLPMYMYM